MSQYQIPVQVPGDPFQTNVSANVFFNAFRCKEIVTASISWCRDDMALVADGSECAWRMLCLRRLGMALGPGGAPLLSF